MKIIISHVYSNDNKGDAALLSVLISDIKRGFSSPDITILTIDNVSQNETFEGVPLRNAFMYYARDTYKNPIAKILYIFYVPIATLLWAIFYRLFKISIPLPNKIKQIALLYKDADLIIPVGGGYIRSGKGLMATARLFFTIHPIIFSYILGKKTVNYTQSVGPFGNKLQEYMARFALRRVNGVIAREQITLDLFKKWGISKNVLLSVDSGFSFESTVTKDVRKDFVIPSEKKIIGITVRSWLANAEQERYEKTIAAVADYIIDKYNAVVIFIPQVTVEFQHDDDRKSSKKVYEYMVHKNEAHVVMDRYDHQTIKAMYANLDYLIGTRFHSVIFSLTSYVPCIAVEYEYKTRGIMRELGLEQWVVNIKNIEIEQVKQLFDRLVLEKESYLTHLKKVLPSYIEQSYNSIYFVKKIYENK